MAPTWPQRLLVVAACAAQLIAFVLIGPPIVLIGMILACITAIPLAGLGARELRVTSAWIGGTILVLGLLASFFGGLLMWPGALLLIAAAVMPTVGWRESRSLGAAVGTIATWGLSGSAAGLLVLFELPA